MEDEEGAGGHMLSFNHYAYGAVIDWVYRHLAGLAPDRTRPGYRHVVFARKPPADIEWARASVHSDLGTTAISWQIEPGGELTADIVLPFGTSGTFIAPSTDASQVLCDGVDSGHEVSLGPGSHRLSVTSPRIANAG